MFVYLMSTFIAHLICCTIYFFLPWIMCFIPCVCLLFGWLLWWFITKRGIYILFSFLSTLLCCITFFYSQVCCRFISVCPFGLCGAIDCHPLIGAFQLPLRHLLFQLAALHYGRCSLEWRSTHAH